MSIIDYDTLVAAVKVWAARSDSTFSGQIPTFIALAEDRIYNGAGKMGDPIYSAPLRSATMEVAGTMTTVDGVGTLPAEALDLRKIVVSGQLTGIEYMTPERLSLWSSNAVSGTPLYYTTRGRDVVLAPPSSATLNLTYYRQYDAITVANKTGPMIIAHGLIYLECALYEAFAFMQETEIAMAHLARARGMIDGANRTATAVRNTGPMRIRQRTPMP